MKAFSLHEVIPDVIDNAPHQVLSVHFPEFDVNCNLGAELTPTQVRKEPQLNWNADPNAFYTVIMTDPDAPSRANPIRREIKHWLVVNVPSNRISEGEVKATYKGSGAPEGTGLHRYIFLIFKQNDKQDFSDIESVGLTVVGRAQFNTREFIRKYGIGELVAGNFFQAQYDNWVAEFRKLISS